MRSLFPACAATAACLAMAVPARAADIDGRTQLQLQTALVNAYSLTFKYDDSYGEDSDEETTFHRDIGFAPRFGVGIGRAFSEHGMFHLLGALSLSSDEFDAGDDTATSKASGVNFEVTPSLRYVASGERARFFVGAGAGVSIANREDRP